MGETIMMWGTIIIFNLAILQLLRVTLRQTNFQQALLEKPAPTKTETLTTTVPSGVPGAGADTVTERTVADVPQVPETSYSRVAGMIGAIVLACFVWAVGNVVLYKMFTVPGEVSTLLASLGTYFLAAASLFAPYAINQLSSAFRPN